MAIYNNNVIKDGGGVRSGGVKISFDVREILSFGVIVVVLSLPLTDVFWIFGRIPAALYLAYLGAMMCMLFIFLNRPQKICVPNKAYISALLILELFVIISFMASDQSPHSIRYFVWYSWIILMYGIVSRLLLQAWIRPSIVVNAIRISVIVASVLGLQEWMAVNNYISIPSFLGSLSRGQDEFHSELLGLIRLRGPVEEAGHFALFLNGLVPLTFLLAFKSRWQLLVYIIIVGIAYMLTMSLAAWFSIIVAIVLVSFLYGWKITKRRPIVVVVPIICLLTMGWILQLDNQLTNRVWDVNDPSRVERLNTYGIALDGVSAANDRELIFGHGPAGYVGKTGTNPISAYLLILYDLGIPALLTFLFVLAYVYIKVFTAFIFNRKKALLLLSLTSMLVHYIITANIWHPWLWFVMAAILYFTSGNYFANAEGNIKGRLRMG